MTYEYACSSCQHEWEAEQSIKEDALTECPKCHGQTARRQISRGTGFILKGGGWYSDLYSSSGNKTEPAASTTKTETPSSDGGGGAESTAKSETSSTTPTTPTTPTKGDSAAAA